MAEVTLTPDPARHAAWTRRATLAAMLGAPALLSATTGVTSSPGRRSPVTKPDCSGFLEAPGGKIWWQKFGSGSRTPVLVVHGGPGAAHNYLLPLRALADERPLIFYDQLGCGLSDAPEHETQLYRIARFVDEIDALRSVLNLDRVMLYGHAWGAIVAIEYMVSGHGAGVERLVLGGAIASIPQYVAGLQRLLGELPDYAGTRLLELEAAGGTSTREYAELLQVFYRRHVLRGAPSPDLETSLAFLGRSPARRILYGPDEIGVRGTIRDWERRKELGAIRVPTLITTGEYDEVSLECHETIRRGVAGSKLRILSNCSHFTMQESPAAYNELLRAFLA